MSSSHTCDISWFSFLIILIDDSVLVQSSSAKRILTFRPLRWPLLVPPRMGFPTQSAVTTWAPRGSGPNAGRPARIARTEIRVQRQRAKDPSGVSESTRKGKRHNGIGGVFGTELLS